MIQKADVDSETVSVGCHIAFCTY